MTMFLLHVKHYCITPYVTTDLENTPEEHAGILKSPAML